MAHRFWRLVGFFTTAGVLELSEARLYAAGALADEGAELSCTVAPVSGTMADLVDGLTTGVVAWPFGAHGSPGFALTWDLGSGADVDMLRLGAGTDAGTFPSDLALQWSDDAKSWSTHHIAIGIVYPGPLAITGVAEGGQVWNPDVNAGSMALSGANLIVTRTASGSYRSSRALVAVTGKRYWEVVVTAGGASVPPYTLTGVVTLSASMDTYVGTSGGWGYHSAAGNLYLNGDNLPPGLPTCLTGDVIMYALDTSTGKLWFGKNGVWFSGGSPSAGTGQQATVTGEVYPAVSLYEASAQLTARFSAGFSYSPPEGFAGFAAPLIPAQVPGKRLTQLAQASDRFAGASLAPGAAGEHLRERTFFDVYHGGRGVIRSTVKRKNTPADTPLRRRVDLIDERSRLVIRSTWSDDVTGNYEFRGVREDLIYSVVAWDHLHTYRAEMADNLTLANGGVELMA